MRDKTTQVQQNFYGNVGNVVEVLLVTLSSIQTHPKRKPWPMPLFLKPLTGVDLQAKAECDRLQWGITGQKT